MAKVSPRELVAVDLVPVVCLDAIQGRGTSSQSHPLLLIRPARFDAALVHEAEDRYIADLNYNVYEPVT